MSVLIYKIFHISAQIENGITLAAEVGLLSRNIKIEGADYADLYKQSFGGRILVGESSHGRGMLGLHNMD